MFALKGSTKAYFFWAGLFIGMGLVSLYLSKLHWLYDPVEKIRYKDYSYIKKEELTSMSKIGIGKQYTQSDFQKMKFSFLKHPAIKNVIFQQNKGILNIKIEERKCLALLEDPKTNQIYDIDKDGFLLSTKPARCKKVPLIRGNFRRFKLRFYNRRLKNVLEALSTIQRIYPSLKQHISEIRLNKDGNWSLFLSNSYMRIDIPENITSVIIRRLYASLSYILNQKIKYGWLELRGTEAILHTR